jgi:hypothetical protein
MDFSSITVITRPVSSITTARQTSRRSLSIRTYARSYSSSYVPMLRSSPPDRLLARPALRIFIHKSVFLIHKTDHHIHNTNVFIHKSDVLIHKSDVLIHKSEKQTCSSIKLTFSSIKLMFSSIKRTITSINQDN